MAAECVWLRRIPRAGHRRVKAAELATKTAKRARKTAITLLFDTQSSRKEAIPPKLVELVGVNACFYVKTWRSNDGFPRRRVVRRGHPRDGAAARPGPWRVTHHGRVRGPVRAAALDFVEVDDDTGFDAAADVIACPVGRVKPGMLIGGGVAAAIEACDLLDDLEDVLGYERVKLRWGVRQFCR